MSMKKSLSQLLTVLLLVGLVACKSTDSNDKVNNKRIMYIPENITNEVINQLKDSLGENAAFRIERGVQQVAGLWQESDGATNDFIDFCKSNFVADSTELFTLYSKLERNTEIFFGYFHKMDVLLKEPLQLMGPDATPIDMMFGSYDVSAHLNDDLYKNKVAFITALNFPYYSLKEKTELGEKWSRKEWAYARMGDRFTARIPADIQQNISKTLTEADAYIYDYNIYMGNLLTDDAKTLFQKDLKLITHWGLRDELKSDYADVENGLAKQRMIYSVMKRIIDQSIPQEVINSDKYTWNPQTNKLYDNGNEVTANPEPDKRYKVLLANYNALKNSDVYYPNNSTYLLRAFEEGMEIPQADVKMLFEKFVSSPQVKEVAALIEKSLGRKLEPFDIWYNGFKGRGGISEDQLTAITTAKYPDEKAVKADLPNILVKLGWKPEKAKQISSLIEVDASRGAGHAWGAAMRNDVAHLRTRIGEKGMDYKGYNIAVHEFGHCVEQTQTMNDVDYYMLNGVPNTAFTEAVAFIFQNRDLELLGVKQPNLADKYNEVLDAFWGCYEIMGVSLVDMQVWEWMYANPNANPAELKSAIISIATDVWNKYYSDVLGGKDEPLLAIYSHMIDNPLYLSNYPIGHLISFQVEQQVEGKNLAEEFERMYLQGRIIPQIWMKNAVGKPIDIEPLLKATEEAILKLK